MCLGTRKAELSGKVTTFSVFKILLLLKLSGLLALIPLKICGWCFSLAITHCCEDYLPSNMCPQFLATSSLDACLRGLGVMFLVNEFSVMEPLSLVLWQGVASHLCLTNLLQITSALLFFTFWNLLLLLAEIILKFLSSIA